MLTSAISFWRRALKVWCRHQAVVCHHLRARGIYAEVLDNIQHSRRTNLGCHEVKVNGSGGALLQHLPSIQCSHRCILPFIYAAIHLPSLSILVAVCNATLLHCLRAFFAHQLCFWCTRTCIIINCFRCPSFSGLWILRALPGLHRLCDGSNPTPHFSFPFLSL